MDPLYLHHACTMLDLLRAFQHVPLDFEINKHPALLDPQKAIKVIQIDY